MTLKHMLVLLTALSALAGEKLETKIIHGFNCDETDFPNAVLILRGDNVGFSKICGGTLIAPDVVLTAAHCIQDPNAKYFVTPQSSLQNLSVYESTGRYATHLVYHSGYKLSNDNGNDIGILFLQNPLPIQPAKLARAEHSKHLTLKNTITLVGWGARQPGPRQDPSQKPAPQKQCAVSSIDGVTKEKIEIGNLPVMPRKCFGDSGGGSYIFDTNKSEYVLVGLSSHGSPGDNGCYKASFDVRVDVHLDWIAQSLKIACQQGVRKSEYCHEL